MQRNVLINLPEPPHMLTKACTIADQIKMLNSQKTNTRANERGNKAAYSFNGMLLKPSTNLFRMKNGVETNAYQI